MEPYVALDAHNGTVERGVERLAVADSNHFYEEQDPGRNPHQCENLDLDPHLHQTDKKSDPGPHQSEK